MSSGREYACYLFINSDLKMGTGKKIVQGCHSIVELMTSLDEKSEYVKECFNIWLETGHKTITLKANQKQMNEIHNMYPSVKIHDAGRTQVNPNSFTVLALFPKIHDKDEFKMFSLVN
uniref:peptidyl-tRNA hydrolase n=1 Tax=viral metagenome TaxID=1070528 RepID=A0A6C0BEK8_9ZZZZ